MQLWSGHLPADVEPRVDQFLAGEAAATIFHTPIWQRFIHDAGGADTRWAVATDASSLVSGVLPFTVAAGTTLQSPPEYLDTIYGGALARDPDTAVRLIAAAGGSARFQARHLAPPPGVDLSSVESAGYRPRKSFLTALVDVRREEDELWKALDGKRVRSPIRKAMKTGVVAAEGTSMDVDSYYALMARTLGHAGHRIPQASFYEQALVRLVKVGMLRFVVARLDNEIIAGAMFLVYSGRSWYWNGAASQQGRELAASDLLQWEHIRWASRIGHTSYDLLRYHPTLNPGIASFKRKFGGREVQLYSADSGTLGWQMRRVLRSAVNPRQSIRKIRQRWGPQAS